MTKILLILFILFISIFPVNAVDNTFYQPTCINPSYDSGYIFMVTENDATIGNVTSTDITTGYLTPSITRVNYGISLLCAISDPTTSGLIGGTQRIFGFSEDGSVWYTDSYPDNYSLGFFSLLYWNPTYKIGTFTAVTSGGKLAIDSSGNVYTNDGNVIKKFVKSLDYTPQTLHTMTLGETGTEDIVHVSGVNDCVASICTAKMLDIKIDSSGNIHMLWGDKVGALAVNNPLGELHHVILDSSGTLVKTEVIATNNKQWAGGSSDAFQGGGLELDATNSQYNFTYGYYLVSSNAGGEHLAIINHNSTAGTSSISGGDITDFTSLTDLAYNNYQIYASSQANNIIRSYITTFAGVLPGSTTSSPAELTYSVSSISSQQTTYANNSNILLNVNVNVDNSALSVAEILLLQENQNYRWKTEINDPSGLLVASHFSDACTLSDYPYLSCFINETLQVSPPVTNWTNGTYTAYLKEYNINTYALATLDSTTYTVLNTSENNTGVIITNPITSGSGLTAIGIVDGWTSLLGLGVNSISKFMFAMLIICLAMLTGGIIAAIAKFGQTMAFATIIGLFPYSFFVYIEYIPSWTIIVLGIVMAIKWGVFK